MFYNQGLILIRRDCIGLMLQKVFIGLNLIEKSLMGHGAVQMIKVLG